MKIAIRYRIVVYVAVIALALAIWLRTPAWFRPRVYSVASGKSSAYLSQAHKYRVLFAGDSRTFTDIQPRTIDPVIGRRSFNLASFGLWMPVQYLEFQEVLPRVPSNTVIVWSLSHSNFVPIGDRWWIPGQYKFGALDAAEFLWDGYPVRRVMREFEESPYSPVDLAVRLRKQVMSSMDEVVWPAKKSNARRRTSSPWQASLLLTAESRAEANEAKAQKILEELHRERRLTMAARVRKDGVVTSVETVGQDGGYDRVVIDRELIRAMQGQLFPRKSREGGACAFVPSDVYLRTFEKILGLIDKYHLKVIVNYIEDAPGSWDSDTQRRCAKQFMLDKIVPILSRHGIEYISPDLYPAIDYSNDWYFDESHLVTEGATIYSKLLAQELAKVLERKGW